MDLGVSDKLKPLLAQVRAFVTEEIAPLEEEYIAEIGVGDRWQFTPRQTEIMEALKGKAKAAGLWNFFLTDGEHGSGLTTVEYAYLAEEMGKSHIAAEVFNCAAPDTGNMEVLHKYGSEDQKREWLEPLLNGEIRSAYAMTEPGVASSDATNICTSAVLEGDEWVINGEKHYISGAGDPRCKIMIVMVKTDPEAPKHLQQSQILVPMNTPGVENLRAMNVFSMDDAPHGHMHQRYTNVRVPKENMILGPGRGFEISQGRLGPGRIHHCMRAIGAAEKALKLLCERAVSRTAFGKPLARLGGNVDIIANARMDIEMARLLTLKTAWMMDNVPPKEARVWISMIKTAVPNISIRIVDQAIQMYGALGVSQDTPLAAMYMAQRTLRLADGPDEVHRMVVGRNELKGYMQQQEVNATFRDG
ncbi:MAG TPA: acyl-CoA dehydrogenase [Halieaceae bacterium]|jgi:acyl-CoA dehydrogenase|uniref:acyl-CoA dehydrogenase family protein n=1 Tax=Haliea TaxID=475794 RepID=UPI000428E4F7|nr:MULTISPECIES: acyl-CoA dehydrogenase family protein [Haliea]HBM83852.1 acyl-CoA dehydrogenase [Halieaceae bacterium]MAD64550.1 acyl-CoA dehydrogenase [Haliea sp.]MAY93048.1 acyl-CoA dehydrogenase [Haliea sp.]MBK39749.1 acyl-CoA dehydrogenase [Haliea sp.]MBP69458.1 acyl-CoA dehydrogenase [Haliea sp.]|tara:strand:+ start:557 stop:1807 length:1251 start_codon:yes stop_codon:yes gene_type:complete